MYCKLKRKMWEFLSILGGIILGLNVAHPVIAWCASEKPTWFEHPDILQVLLVTAFAGFMYMVGKTINQVLNSIEDLYKKYGDVKSEVDKLQGEHNAYKSLHEA